MPEWTPAQNDAIKSRNGTVLVSAAAGSGKTAVLVERVIQRLEDENYPCPADSLLIVTFTKEATSQMREKIALALDKRIEESPENEHLIKQRMLLPFATISTIDSFCGEIVKENFHELNISPDYKIAEDAELNLMKLDAVELVLEKAFKEKREGFDSLIAMIVTEENDNKLKELIMNLHNTSKAYAFPERWLDSFAVDYENITDFSKTVWGRFLTGCFKETCDYHINRMKAEKLRFNDDMEAKNGELFQKEISYLEKFSALCESGTWDELIELSTFFTKDSIKNTKKYEYYSSAKAVRTAAKDDMVKIISDFLYCSQAEFEEDMTYLKPVVNELIRLVKDYDREFSLIKHNANVADFSDICAYALKLLLKDVDSEGNPVKTELAESVSQRFTEILVDEFQDINEQQNLLFKVLSKNESNLFMVGDVKQSIYKFRLAMPQIFINIKKSFPDYINDNYPARINLDYNFRSRKGVTDFINFIFCQLMSEDVGDIDYDENEALKPKAVYAPSDSPDAEIHILRKSDDFSKAELEAEYAAEYIENAIKNGLTVKDGDGVRRAEYRDFCILMRKAKDRMSVFTAALKNRGIPCYAANSEGFFKATEVRTILSVMRVVDNPLQDIPLLSAMISPIFGFSPDELASLRAEKPHGAFWLCVKEAAENGKKKCADFIEEIKRLRTLSVTLGSGEFLREIYDSTGYISTVRAMTNGSQRAANLSLLLDYAEKYESSGHIGLSGFIRFIDRVEKNKKDFDVANEISESANVVRLMTIHKSKGLEFPVCILAGCSEKFNSEYKMAGCDYVMNYGIGFRRVTGEKRFKTLPYSAVAEAHSRSNCSEDMRLLYVALTRAKEKMVCLLQYDNPKKKIAEAMERLDKEKKISPVNVLRSTSFSDMILLPMLRHFDSNSIPTVSESRTVDVLPCDSPVLFKLVDEYDFSIAADKDNIEKSTVNENTVKLIEQRVSYKYPYSNLSSLVAKVSPSQLENTGSSAKFFAKSKPAFLEDKNNGGASKGTAVHKFMEFYDYKSDQKDVRVQAETMVKKNMLTSDEEKLLDYSSLSDFFTSKTAERIFSADIIEREKKITFAVGADEIYGSEYSHNEKIIVQGYIDCAFIENGEWVIVDYKTDRVKDMNTLAERYSGQLKMYERALYECTGIPVKETVIYSLYKNETILLK